VRRQKDFELGTKETRTNENIFVEVSVSRKSACYKLSMMRSRFSSSSIMDSGMMPISCRNDSLATAITWPNRRSLSRAIAALALFEAQPKNPRVFYKPSRGGDDYRRRIPCLIDEI
jgi:hypothetical protein